MATKTYIDKVYLLDFWKHVLGIPTSSTYTATNAPSGAQDKTIMAHINTLYNSKLSSVTVASNGYLTGDGTSANGLNVDNGKIQSATTTTGLTDPTKLASKGYVDEQLNSKAGVKSVSKASGETLIDASTTNNAVTISSTDALKTAVTNANSALQSVAVGSYLSGDGKATATGVNINTSKIQGYNATEAKTGDNNLTSKKYVDDSISTALTSAMNYKGAKATYAELPTTGNKTGDFWDVQAEFTIGSGATAKTYPAGTNVAWNGSSWDVIGGDASVYQTKTLSKTIADATTVEGALEALAGKADKDTTYTIGITAGTSSAAPKVKLTPSEGDAQEVAITTASTSVYGATKLSSATNSDSEALAATPKAVKAAYDLANGKVSSVDVPTTEKAISVDNTDAKNPKISLDQSKITITKSQVSDFPTNLLTSVSTTGYLTGDGTSGSAINILSTKIQDAGSATGHDKLATKGYVDSMQHENTTYTFGDGTATTGVGTFTVTPSGGTAQTVTVYGIDTTSSETWNASDYPYNPTSSK